MGKNLELELLYVENKKNFLGLIHRLVLIFKTFRGKKGEKGRHHGCHARGKIN